MKIYKKLHKAIEDMMEKYNNYVSEDKQIGWAEYIDAAIASALEGDHTDWSKAAHLEFLDKSFQIVREFPSKDIYHKIMSKVAHDRAITFDDAMCFVCKNYLVRFEMITKKAQLDATWDGDNVLIALHVCGKMTDGIKIDGKKLTMTCPDCDHPDMAIYYESGHIHCYSGSCKHTKSSGHDIWTLLAADSKSFATIVDKVYTAVVVNHAASMDIIDNLEYKVRQHRRNSNGKDIDNANIPKIMAMCKPEYDYMYQFGFSRKDLDECDCIGLKDGTVTERCNEANEYRYRLCWAIKDISGKVVGLQGRSILNDAERAEFVDNDDMFRRMYAGDEDKAKKNKEKVLNTFGFAKSNHLYMLYKYVQDASQYNKLVITEGIKDAMRVAQIHCPDVAVVASFGCSLSDRQVELLKQTFDKDIIIELAYDGDKAGFKGSLDAARLLTEAGFRHIRFVLYREKNKTEYYKDFGDFIISYAPKRSEFISRMLSGVRLEDYIKAAKERGFYEEPKPVVIKKKAEIVVEKAADINDRVKQSIIQMLRAKKQAAAGKVAAV